jgi:hypothetical protein
VEGVLGALTGMALGAWFIGGWDGFPWAVGTAAVLLIVLGVYRSMTRRRATTPPA